MMKRSLLAAGAAAVLALGLFSPVAFATETEPSAECVAAQSALAAVPEPVGVPSDLEQKDRQAKAVLAELPTEASDGSELVVSREEIERLERKLDHPLAGEKIAAIEDLLKAQDAADTAAANLAADQERFAAEKQAVADAEALVEEACETPAGEEPPAGEQGSGEQNTEDEGNDAGTNATVQAGDQDDNGSSNPPLVFNFESDPVNTGVASSVPVGSVDTGA